MNRLYARSEKAPAIRLLKSFKWYRERPLYGYPMSIGFLLASFAIQYFGRSFFQGAPFLTLYLAVVGSTFIGGAEAGLAVAAIDGTVQWVFFIPKVKIIAILTYAFDASLCVMMLDFLNHVFDLMIDLLKEEQKSVRRHYLVSRELHHRIQNLFSVVQSVIRMSMPGHNEKCRSLRAGIVDRLHAMSATNVMISECEQNGVQLRKLVEPELAASNGRIQAVLTDGVVLGGQLAQNLSLILHELVTNAIKHGALSVHEGAVVLNIQCEPGRLMLRWHEHDGPRVKPPEGEGGFGTRLLDNFAKRLGSVVCLYNPTGLMYSLKIISEDVWFGDQPVQLLPNKIAA